MGHGPDLSRTGVMHWHPQRTNQRRPYLSSGTMCTKRAPEGPVTVAAETELAKRHNRRCQHLPGGLLSRDSHSRARLVLVVEDVFRPHQHMKATASAGCRGPVLLQHSTRVYREVLSGDRLQKESHCLHLAVQWGEGPTAPGSGGRYSKRCLCYFRTDRKRRLRCCQVLKTLNRKIPRIRHEARSANSGFPKADKLHPHEVQRCHKWFDTLLSP